MHKLTKTILPSVRDATGAMRAISRRPHIDVHRVDREER